MWEPIGQGRDGYRLTIRATRVSVRQLVVIILGCVLGGGGAATAVLIVISLETDSLLGRSDVVLIAGGLAVVIALALLWIFAWRRKRYVVEWDDAGIRVIGAGVERSYPWACVARVLIRLDTDYARVEVRSADRGSVSLLAGFGSQDVKKTTAIDPIPDGVVELLGRHLSAAPPPQRNALGLHVFLGAQQPVA